ncbi:MAG: type I methionyl aminopeptidase [Bacteroidota bacterium]
MKREKIHYKSEEEISCIRTSSLLVSKTLAEVGKLIEPGVSTLKLDEVAEAFIRDHGATPAFKNHHPAFAESPFPYSLCISVNEEVVHGMPGAKKRLREGDIVSVDCGVKLNKYYGDSAYTFTVGSVSEEKKKLLIVTREALYAGIKKACEGNFLGDISNAIQTHVQKNGFSVIRELVGHGVGKNLHEAPEVPNYGPKKTGLRLRRGLVIAIEPMINMGKRHVEVADDGWTIYAKDHLASAHFEHTIVVRNGEPEILTTFDLIEN